MAVRLALEEPRLVGVEQVQQETLLPHPVQQTQEAAEAAEVTPEQVQLAVLVALAVAEL